MHGWLELLLVFVAGAAAGGVNALAGGGTLITFPTLVALGLPAITANVTNTVGLCPGYLGATLAQVKDMRGQGRRLWLMVPAAAVGGIVGGFLLLNTGEKMFGTLVPYLLLLASALLAAQGKVRGWLLKQTNPSRSGAISEAGSVAAIALAAVYGGYFGAGLSVIVLATLGLLLHDTITRLNALKQAIALSTNVAAATYFIIRGSQSGQVAWVEAVVLAAGALLGGAAGGRLAGRVKPATLRWTVVVIGAVVGVAYLFKH